MHGRTLRYPGRALSVALTLAALLYAPARAQDPPPPPADEEAAAAVVDRWRIELDLGFSAASGNSDLVVLTSGFELRHLLTDDFQFEWELGYQYGESESEVVRREWKSSLEVTVYPRDRVSAFAVTNANRNPFKKLDLKTQSGAGVRFQPYRSSDGNLTVKASALYDRQQYLTKGDPSLEPVDTNGRWQVEVTGMRRLGAVVRLDNATKYVPIWDAGDDYTFENVLKASSQISRTMALSFRHKFEHDSTPRPGVKRDDHNVYAGLTFTF
ncbi:MAG: DUF481 domain-containing protein [Gemmatimonadota bacterium]